MVINLCLSTIYLQAILIDAFYKDADSFPAEMLLLAYISQTPIDTVDADVRGSNIIERPRSHQNIGSKPPPILHQPVELLLPAVAKNIHGFAGKREVINNSRRASSNYSLCYAWM